MIGSIFGVIRGAENVVIACYCCEKVTEDKKRAQVQYDAFKQLESVGYFFEREQISSAVTESRTSNQEIGRIEMSCDRGTCLSQRCT